MNNGKTMLPPWKNDSISQKSILWRMGGGEYYQSQWHDWFKLLGESEQQAYIAQYPEPEDWFGFYRLHLLPPINFSAVIEECGDNPNNLPEDFWEKLHQSRYDLVEQIDRLEKSYCRLHNELALIHEEARHIQQAVDHLGKVIFLIERHTIWEAAQVHEAKQRYRLLKRRLAEQMAINPVVRENWDSLRRTEHRASLSLQHSRISFQDYEKIQLEVFFPIELGRTWTKCVEDDTLYIHRHWQEPCLFLLVFEAEGQSYRIREAWMNLDPAISRPLTLPEKEPEALLAWLLKRLVIQEES